MIITLVVLVLSATLLAVLYRAFGIGIPCLIHETTGLYCPGCGGIRAMDALLSLDFYQALRYNALIFVVPPVIVLLIAYALFNKNRDSIQGKWQKMFMVLGILLAILLAAYTIARNIPGLEFLQPTTI